jgi:hypothetical protein
MAAFQNLKLNYLKLIGISFKNSHRYYFLSISFDFSCLGKNSPINFALISLFSANDDYDNAISPHIGSYLVCR